MERRGLLSAPGDITVCISYKISFLNLKATLACLEFSYAYLYSGWDITRQLFNSGIELSFHSSVHTKSGNPRKVLIPWQISAAPWRGAATRRRLHAWRGGPYELWWIFFLICFRRQFQVQSLDDERLEIRMTCWKGQRIIRENDSRCGSNIDRNFLYDLYPRRRGMGERGGVGRRCNWTKLRWGRPN